MNSHILTIAVGTLAFVMIAVMIVFLYGLFDTRVDNSELFKIIGPAFQMIVGAFTGLVGGYKLGRADGATRND